MRLGKNVEVLFYGVGVQIYKTELIWYKIFGIQQGFYPLFF